MTKITFSILIDNHDYNHDVIISRRNHTHDYDYSLLYLLILMIVESYID